MLIPSGTPEGCSSGPSLSRRVNANSQLMKQLQGMGNKLIKKGEC